jgi:hypothetical protein
LSSLDRPDFSSLEEEVRLEADSDRRRDLEDDDSFVELLDDDSFVECLDDDLLARDALLETVDLLSSSSSSSPFDASFEDEELWRLILLLRPRALAAGILTTLALPDVLRDLVRALVIPRASFILSSKSKEFLRSVSALTFDLREPGDFDDDFFLSPLSSFSLLLEGDSTLLSDSLSLFFLSLVIRCEIEDWRVAVGDTSVSVSLTEGIFFTSFFSFSASDFNKSFSVKSPRILSIESDTLNLRSSFSSFSFLFAIYDFFFFW